MSRVSRISFVLCAFFVSVSHNARGIALDGNVSTWPSGNVYYTFSNNVSVVEQKEFIDAASEWAMFANVHFIPRTNQTNYITVAEIPPNPNGSEGGASSVGMDGGQQFIVLSPAAWSRSVICHEIGHALGCIHEQNRSDRDSYIQILSNNVTPGYPGFFVLTNSRNPTVYDFHSIMHYGPYSGAIDPTQPTTIPLPTYSQYAPVGRDEPPLSFFDRVGMAVIYGNGPTLSSVVTNTQDSGVGSLRAALYFAYDHPGTTVTFNIPTNDPGYSNGVFNIQLTDKLPCLVSRTSVDGTSQPGYVSGIPLIHLDGSPSTVAGRFAYGLRMRGTNCVVQGLAIDGFQVDGILIDSGASSNLVGGYTVSARNILSHNGRSNVAISGTNTDNGVMILKNYTAGNVVAGNFIGISSSALNPAGLNEGVLITESARSNLIGGVIAGACNVISSNAGSGVFISGTGTQGNAIQGNYIGLNAAGSAPQANVYYGVEIAGGASFNLIGGTGAGNVISGNKSYGINIYGSNTVGNIVQGNFVGVNPFGTTGIGNGNSGVAIDQGAKSNLIGGILTGNVISGNGGSGVFIADAGTTGNIIEGNYIGLNAAGSSGIANAYYGVEIYTPLNTIGGNLAGAGNVVSGNGASGIFLSSASASGNSVLGNYIGLNAVGSAAIPNAVYGVEIMNGAMANFIGGANAARNFISGNYNSGIAIHDSGTAANVIQGNTIGLNVTGTTAVPNGGSGVFLAGSAQSNLIGGTTFGSPNTIASNSFYGIELGDAATSNNTLRANSIYGNGANSISLSGGANRSATAPSLTSATLTTNTTISGSLTSFANTTFQIDFYSSPNSSAQGMTYLGAKNVTTSAGGSVSFTASLAGHVPAGRIITATATDPAGNTSGMSGGVTVAATSTVNDGIPNAWRALYFGGSGTTTNSQSCATCDADGTGMNNFQKFLAGLNPTNSASVLRLNALSSNVSNNVASFLSAPGTIYRVLSRDDLASGFWSIDADQVVGTGTNIFIADPNIFSTAKRFYRLQVLW
jgi:hypothetical protein